MAGAPRCALQALVCVAQTLAAARLVRAPAPASRLLTRRGVAGGKAASKARGAARAAEDDSYERVAWCVRLAARTPTSAARR